jgi:hypothetical protein
MSCSTALVVSSWQRRFAELDYLANRLLGRLVGSRAFRLPRRAGLVELEISTCLSVCPLNQGSASCDSVDAA